VGILRLLPAAVALLATSAAAGERGALTVVVRGIDGARGSVLVRLADSAEDYRSESHPVRAAKVPASADPVTVTFPDLDYGEYAVKAFHDANDNGKLDPGPRGPAERYGFSNGARGFLGAPRFDEAKVRLAAPASSVEVVLR
jgi:uncharacterized protein (DUF2141 family)